MFFCLLQFTLWRQCQTEDGKARQTSKNTRRTKHKEKVEMLDRVHRPTGTEREGNRLNAPGREVDEGQVKLAPRQGRQSHRHETHKGRK